MTRDTQRIHLSIHFRSFYKTEFFVASGRAVLRHGEQEGQEGQGRRGQGWEKGEQEGEQQKHAGLLLLNSLSLLLLRLAPVAQEAREEEEGGRTFATAAAHVFVEKGGADLEAVDCQGGEEGSPGGACGAAMGAGGGQIPAQEVQEDGYCHRGRVGRVKADRGKDDRARLDPVKRGSQPQHHEHAVQSDTDKATAAATTAAAPATSASPAVVSETRRSFSSDDSATVTAAAPC